MAWIDVVTDLESRTDVLRKRRYGVIVAEHGQLSQIILRPWPKVVSLAEVLFWGHRFHDQRPGDRCWLYYNQPLRHGNFLALKYVLSSRDATLQTFRCCLTVLDEIARIKHTDALVCEASNVRISDRLLQRWGWEAHVPSSRRRHFIKRFYGSYPFTRCAVRS
jgi:hypothetical protein